MSKLHPQTAEELPPCDFLAQVGCVYFNCIHPSVLVASDLSGWIMFDSVQFLDRLGRRGYMTDDSAENL